MVSRRRSRRAIRFFRSLLVAGLGVLGIGTSAHAAGVTIIHPYATNIWELGANDSSFRATMTEVQLPNCLEGSCPVDLITVFSNGYVDILNQLAGVSQVVQVTNTQYVVATGSCTKGSCDLGAYAINRRREATASLLVVAQIDLSKARCGLHFTYAGGTYTLKPVLTPLQGAGPGFYLPHVFAGVPACA